jgi:hypothetical protein
LELPKFFLFTINLRPNPDPTFSLICFSKIFFSTFGPPHVSKKPQDNIKENESPKFFLFTINLRPNPDPTFSLICFSKFFFSTFGPPHVSKKPQDNIKENESPKILDRNSNDGLP